MWHLIPGAVRSLAAFLAAFLVGLIASLGLDIGPEGAVGLENFLVALITGGVGYIAWRLGIVLPEPDEAPED